MKTFKSKFSFLLPIFLVLFFSSNLFGETIWVVNSSNTSASTSPSPYENDSDITTTLSIPGATELSVTISGEVEDGFWWRGTYYIYDFVEIEATDGTYNKYDGAIDDTFTVNASSISLRFYSDWSETRSGVTITITDISPNVPPVVTPETFSIYQTASIGELIGTVSATNTPTSFTIESGDIDNLFSIDNSGAITVANTLDTNSTSSYDLNVSATNTYGTGSAIITINLISDIPLSTDSVNTRDFTNVPILGKESVTISGSILQIGNQILCKNSYNFDECEDPGTTGYTQNNYHTQYLARIDNTVNHSNTMAKLVMEADDEVIFARLYWSARIEYASDTEIENAKNIKIKGPASSTYTQLSSLNSKFNWHDSGTDLGDGFFDYAASTDVTQYIKTNGSGEYYVGDISVTTGETGTYASWQLIVIVKNSSRSLKNISIYDGFYSIYSGSSDYPDSVTVPASGFITPTGSEPFDANLFVYAGESDDGYSDSSEILDGDGNWVSLVDGQNDPNDVMNASVSSSDYTGGYRSNDADMANPNFRNVLGVDIDKLKINDKYDTSKQTLSNSQTSTEIKLSSAGDRYSLNMFAFETEVFVPEFCYDYAYSQYNSFFTEDNDGTQAPRLTGEVDTHEPITMKIYLKSMVDSNIQIQNMTIDISDINRTQATYITDTTLLATTGELVPTAVTVSAGTAGNFDYINDIDIGILNQNDYFYLYYDLDPQTTTMDMPISVEASYNLVLDVTSVDYTLKLSEQIPLCSDNNFKYTPAKGIFNVAHNDYYTNTSTDNANPNGTQYYNLPTQVTKREGNFKVLSMDTDDFDQLYSRSTIVAVEMIDAGAFHYTDASCSEFESSITDRVWVEFGGDDFNSTSVAFTQAAIQAAIDADIDDGTNLYDMSSSAEFYKTARQNTAFRITYNSTDENGTVPYLVKSDGQYEDLAWLSRWSGEDCVQDMVTNGLGNDNTVASYCNITNSSSTSEIALCMECIYGKDTRFICSRDNFAIRPEAFMIKIDDQNQTTDSVPQLRIADNVSGVTTPDTTQVELASVYSYNLEVNATNHLSNTSSLGYTRTFNSLFTDNVEYTWQPSAAAIDCDDDSNTSISMKFVDGKIDQNTSVNQVGEYLLNITDTEWTIVDSDPLYISHHDDSTYFLFNNDGSIATDCVLYTSTTQAVNVSPYVKNGCYISSNHDSSGSTLKYRDYDIEFHPYSFSITPTLYKGLNQTSSFVYMADIDTDENMSVQLNGVIGAIGKNNLLLTNYTKGCYAYPITITIDTIGVQNTALSYKYKFSDINSSGTRIHDLNSSLNPTFTTIDGEYFEQDMGGKLDTTIRMNFDRSKSIVANPEDINFTTYRVLDSVNSFNADLVSDKTADANVSINETVIHYYGRTHASRQRYEGDTGTANIYYEVYCFGDTNGSKCDGDKKLLLPSLTRTDDIRWYINVNHDISNDGNITDTPVAERAPNNFVTEDFVNRDISNPSITKVNLIYDGTKYPYKTTMQNDASTWLIYNEDDPTATRNEFSVEFEKAGTGWSGEHNTSTTTKDVGAVKTNRRSMW